MARLVGALHLPRTMARGSAALAHYPQGAYVAPTGGIVAAPTTSLPEQLGGVRNWDYRYCWVRDASFTLYALLSSGYTDEAKCWRDWLLRAVAGMPSQLNIMYGLAGERRLTEITLPWLPGYENSAPVRIGNAAHGQFQLDVFGEVIAALNLRGAMASSRTRTPGTSSVLCSITWRPPGTSPMKVSGKCAGRGGISPIPK